MEQIIKIDISKIKINPLQPRKEFNKAKLIELSKSIKKRGLINPIQVKKDKNGYILVCGERRLKAHKLAKLKKINAIVKKYNSQEEEQIESLIENVHRSDLNFIEKENFIDLLWKTGKYKTYQELAKALGYDDSYISQIMIGKKLREKTKSSKIISTRVLNDVNILKDINDVKTILQKVEKKEIDKSKVREFSRVVKNSPIDVKQALFSNKISLNQATKLKEVSDKGLRDKMISAHNEIKKIDRDLDKCLKYKTKEKIDDNKIIQINKHISNFRHNTLEVQKQMNVILNDLISCVKNIDLMDDKQTKQFKHFQELFEMNLSNSLEMSNNIKKKFLNTNVYI